MALVIVDLKVGGANYVKTPAVQDGVLTVLAMVHAIVQPDHVLVMPCGVESVVKSQTALEHQTVTVMAIVLAPIYHTADAKRAGWGLHVKFHVQMVKCV